MYKWVNYSVNVNKWIMEMLKIIWMFLINFYMFFNFVVCWFKYKKVIKIYIYVVNFLINVFVFKFYELLWIGIFVCVLIKVIFKS